MGLAQRVAERCVVRVEVVSEMAQGARAIARVEKRRPAHRAKRGGSVLFRLAWCSAPALTCCACKFAVPYLVSGPIACSSWRSWRGIGECLATVHLGIWSFSVLSPPKSTGLVVMMRVQR